MCKTSQTEKQIKKVAAAVDDDDNDDDNTIMTQNATKLFFKKDKVMPNVTYFITMVCSLLQLRFIVLQQEEKMLEVVKAKKY